MSTQKQRAAYEQLDAAIAALVDAYGDDAGTGVAVDAALIVGMQHVDDDGDRVGSVALYPRHGSQPAYITAGLLDSALHLVRNAE